MTTFVHQFADRVNRSGFLGGSAVPEYRTVEFNLTADQVANGNVFEFLRIPGDAVVLDLFLHADELDTDGTPTLTINVGHDGDASAFLTNSTIAQTGGTVAATAGIPLLPRDPTDPVDDDSPFGIPEEGTVISATLSAAAATAAAGRLALTVGFVRTR